ncbi:UPF0415 protein C7orf25 homolog [Argopecten irradians]|uniref:UPF0415 protein C7orf25 homolog n=1 Tax=Argopecten irradians TaxID=31199 RepID=UPI003717DF34
MAYSRGSFNEMAADKGETESCGKLLLVYLQEAEALVQKCQQHQTIKGMHKLEKKCRADWRYLQTLSKKTRGPINECQLKSSNLSHFAGILHAMQVIPSVECMMKAIRSPNRTENLHVDIVAGQGQVWVKVIARKAQALHLIWAGEGQFGDRDIVSQADDYITCANTNPVNFRPPTVHFAFYSQVTKPMAEALEAKGVRVWGERVEVDREVTAKLQVLDDIYQDSDDEDSIEDSEDYTDEENNEISSDNERSTDQTNISDSDRLPGSYTDLPVSNEQLHALDQDQLASKTELLVSNESFYSENRASQKLPHLAKQEPVPHKEPIVTEPQLTKLEPVSHKESFVSEPQLTKQELVPHKELLHSDGLLINKSCMLPKTEISSTSPNAEKFSHTETHQSICTESTGSCDQISVGRDTRDYSSNTPVQLIHTTPSNLDQSHSHISSVGSNEKDLFISCLLLSVPKYDVSEMLSATGKSHSNNSLQIRKVNLDITTLITMVSAVTHGGCHFVFPEEILTLQAKEERNHPALPELHRFLHGKELYACQTAWDDFETILNTLGGPEEKKRARLLRKKVTIVSDQPSQRTQDLPETGKIRLRTKGVSFAVYGHPSRALTEEKEKNATPLDQGMV